MIRIAAADDHASLASTRISASSPAPLRIASTRAMSTRGSSDLVAHPAAEQVDQRLGAGLAHDVPAGHLDRRDRRAGRLDVMPGADDVDPFHDAFDPERILADDKRLDRLEHGEHDVRAGVRGGFADADRTVVGVDVDEDTYQAGAASVGPDLVGDEGHGERRRLWSGDAHRSPQTVVGLRSVCVSSSPPDSVTRTVSDQARSSVTRGAMVSHLWRDGQSLVARAVGHRQRRGWPVEPPTSYGFATASLLPASPRHRNAAFGERLKEGGGSDRWEVSGRDLDGRQPRLAERPRGAGCRMPS